jgi:hypothetical protein
MTWIAWKIVSHWMRISPVDTTKKMIQMKKKRKKKLSLSIMRRE